MRALRAAVALILPTTATALQRSRGQDVHSHARSITGTVTRNARKPWPASVFYKTHAVGCAHGDQRPTTHDPVGAQNEDSHMHDRHQSLPVFQSCRATGALVALLFAGQLVAQNSTFCPDRAAGHCRPYDATSAWNTPIPVNPLIDPQSAVFINAIADNNLPLTSDVDQFAIALYLYNAATPRASVQLDGFFSSYDNGDNSRVGHGFQPLVTGVPIPTNAQAGNGSDAQITFWDPVAETEYGFWQFARNGAGNYTATNGNRYHTGSGYYGRFADGLAGRGAGTPYFSGLVRPWEMAQGRIDHALSFAYNSPAAEFRYPASSSDGEGVTGVDPPEGARLQLDPALTEGDLINLGLNANARVIARALQVYGMFIIDNSGSSKIYLEDRSTANWDASFTRNLVSALPWSRFRVLDASVSTPGQVFANGFE